MHPQRGRQRRTSEERAWRAGGRPSWAAESEGRARHGGRKEWKKRHAMGESREVELMEVIRSADVTSTGGMFFD